MYFILAYKLEKLSVSILDLEKSRTIFILIFSFSHFSIYIFFAIYALKDWLFLTKKRHIINKCFQCIRKFLTSSSHSPAYVQEFQIDEEWNCDFLLFPIFMHLAQGEAFCNWMNQNRAVCRIWDLDCFYAVHLCLNGSVVSVLQPDLYPILE